MPSCFHTAPWPHYLGMGRILATTFPLARCSCSQLISTTLPGGPGDSLCPSRPGRVPSPFRFPSSSDHNDLSLRLSEFGQQILHRALLPLCIYDLVYDQSLQSHAHMGIRSSSNCALMSIFWSSPVGALSTPRPSYLHTALMETQRAHPP